MLSEAIRHFLDDRRRGLSLGQRIEQNSVDRHVADVTLASARQLLTTARERNNRTDPGVDVHRTKDTISSGVFIADRPDQPHSHGDPYRLFVGAVSSPSIRLREREWADNGLPKGKEKRIMFGRHHFPWFLLALVGGMVVSSVASPARATIILAVPTASLPGASYGVIACLYPQCVYAPATENPAKAFSGTVEAAMTQNGSFISFAFTLSGSFGQTQVASSASTPTFNHNIEITILGTAGEPVGTPVLLHLSNFVTPDPGPPSLDPTISNFLGPDLHGVEYGPNTDVLINGFKVGDSFWYWPLIATQGNTAYTYSVNLSVQETGISAIPEPGTLALLMTAGLSLGVVLTRRRGRIKKSFSAGG
jgi:hypothetical protein